MLVYINVMHLTLVLLTCLQNHSHLQGHYSRYCGLVKKVVVQPREPMTDMMLGIPTSVHEIPWEKMFELEMMT